MLSTSQQGRKQELIQRLTASRSAIRYQRGRLTTALDLKTQIATSVRQSPAKWAIGSAVTGLLGSRFLRSKKKRAAAEKAHHKTKGGFLSKTLTGVLVALIRPLLLNYLKQRTSTSFK